ncbi:DUF4321 domain-containing protein [uncultured Megasphaera sp.]|uniref:DUF4321 domain-containing protein n=1 Tax=uncultured Megasphaera sp. TaxID=165188 RepID=UPI0025998586|nr:DUF4321 domain-containing protein [uncultured Megasphaera sp.]
MKRAASMGVFWCILFLVGGGIAGGILGDALSAASVGNVMPLLTRHYEIFDIENIAVNLYVLEFHFGIRFAPNILSIAGFIAAWLLVRRVR